VGADGVEIKSGVELGDEGQTVLEDELAYQVHLRESAQNLNFK